MLRTEVKGEATLVAALRARVAAAQAVAGEVEVAREAAPEDATGIQTVRQDLRETTEQFGRRVRPAPPAPKPPEQAVLPKVSAMRAALQEVHARVLKGITT